MPVVQRRIKMLKRTLAAIALAVLALTSAARAADRVPPQFVGNWCAGQSPAEDETIYNRSRTCKSAHEPEDIMTI